MRRSLIVLPQILSKVRQEKLIAYLKKKTGIVFVFKEEKHFYLIDNELIFLQGLSDISPKSYNIESKINRILDSKLYYENGFIKNLSGSFGLTYEVFNGDEVWIKKEPRYLKDSLNREYVLAHRLRSNDNEFVPKVENFNEEDGSYLQEEAVDSLECYISSTKDLPNMIKLKIVEQIVKAIRHIHSFGVIHRDLHPGNIFKFKDGKWKVSDFGLSYDSISNLSCVEKHNGVYGNPDYISPEQKEHLNNSTFQSDIFSVGKLINFIFNKKPNCYNHPLKNISLKCCSKNPNKRYNNVTLLLEDILKVSII